MCRSTWAWHCLAGHPRSWGGSRRRRNSQSRWWWPPIRSHRPSCRCNWQQGYYGGQRSVCTSLDRLPGRWSGIQLKGRKNELRVRRYKWLNTRTVHSVQVSVCQLPTCHNLQGRRKPQLQKYPHPTSLWACQWGTFFINDWCGKVQPTVGHATHGQVVLGCVKKVEHWASQ